MTGTATTRLTAGYSTATAESVSNFLATQYALQSPIECTLLRRGFNDSFEALAADGQRYVLRLSCRRLRGEADVASETDFLAYLDAVGVPVAAPVPARDGALFTSALLPEGSRPAVLFRLIEGRSPKAVRRTLREQIVILHRRLLAIVRDDEVCRRLMTTPGVGPVVALTYRATVDVPARFRKSKAVGAVFGLTCAKYQSGEIDRNGRISRCGDEMMRVMLYEAAQSMLRSKKWSWLKAWAMQIARRRGMKKAIVALARRLAVIMHRIWVDGTEFRWTREQAAAAA